MNDYPLHSYLAMLADRDLFGSLALFNLAVLIAGLYGPLRRARAYRVMCVLAMLCMPVLHAVGTYYLNQRVA